MRGERNNDAWLIDREESRPAYGSERALFIQRTYLTLAVAVLAFVGLETLLVVTFRDVGMNIARAIFGNGMIGMLLVLGAFMGVSFLAQMWARGENPPAVQYMGLGLFVVAEAVIFLPILFMAVYGMGEKGAYILPQAAIITLALFGGLTLTAFMTRKDFSFLGPILSIGFMIALGTIIAGIIFGFSLGLFFCFAVVALLAGSILYETSNILHHYNTNQHVAAALALFASLATMFWYVLRILMILNSRE